MDGTFRNPSSFSGVYPEKREVPRFTFIATVVLTELASDLHIPGRISEISRKGCYVDVLTTLPVGTKVRIDVSRDQGTFTAPAQIIYVQEGIGMGIGFLDVAEPQLKILDSWLAELTA